MYWLLLSVVIETGTPLSHTAISSGTPSHPKPFPSLPWLCLLSILIWSLVPYCAGLSSLYGLLHMGYPSWRIAVRFWAVPWMTTYHPFPALSCPLSLPARPPSPSVLSCCALVSTHVISSYLLWEKVEDTMNLAPSTSFSLLVRALTHRPTALEQAGVFVLFAFFFSISVFNLSSSYGNLLKAITPYSLSFSPFCSVYTHIGFRHLTKQNSKQKFLPLTPLLFFFFWLLQGFQKE